MRKNILNFLPAALLALAAMTPQAGAYVIDQECTPEIFGEWSLSFLGPLGQEFTPATTRLNVVEAWISHGFVGTEPPTDIVVRVRAGTITGPVLGQSAAATVTDGHFAPVRFDFASPVELTPGLVYVLEAAVVGGGGNPLIGGMDGSSYAGGRAVAAGAPFDADLWFRTGATEDVPVTATSWGAVKALFRP